MIEAREGFALTVDRDPSEKSVEQYHGRNPSENKHGQNYSMPDVPIEFSGEIHDVIYSVSVVNFPRREIPVLTKARIRTAVPLR
jgi:hypothetical protein